MVRFSLLALLSVFLVKCSGEPQIMNLIKFDDSNSDPDALCNDGTRGGYYFSKAIDPSQADVFVVHLPGGGQCYDKPSCDSRAANLKSFSYAAPTISVTGFLDASSDNTPLWGANKAYLYYCSSDGYMGDAPASAATWGYHFRGQRLVHSLFQALALNHGFNESTLVYLTGSSAGARGYMAHIDQLVEQWIPSSASVIGLLDSPYYLDVSPYSPDSKGFQYQEQQKYKYYNTQAILSADCVAAYPHPDDQWKCQFGEHRMPFVKTPYFLIFDQFDSYQLNELTGSSPSVYTPATAAYTEEFALYGRTSVTNLSISTGSTPPPPPVAHPHSSDMEKHAFIRNGHFAPPKAHVSTVATTSTISTSIPKPASAGPGYGYYSPACYYHAIGTSNLFYTTATDDKTILRDAFASYLSHFPAGVRKRGGEMKEVADVFVQEWRGSGNVSEVSGGGSGDSNNVGLSSHAHHDHTNHHKSGGGWVMSWIDSCVGVACGRYCNGIV